MTRAAIVFACVLAGTGLAAAQPAPAPDKTDAKALMQSGLKLFAAKDYLGALAVFKDAYARFASAKILLNIATTLRQLDRSADAANAYQHYLDSSDADDKKKPEVAKVLATLDKKVGILELAVTPAGATVVIGEDTVTTPKHRVSPGDVTVRVTADKFQPYETKVTATANKSTAVTIALAAISEPTTPITNGGTGTGTGTGTGPIVNPGELRGRGSPESPQSQFGAVALMHVDVGNSGAAALVGITATLTDRLQVQAAALLGKTQGGYAGASFALLRGWVRPIVVAGMPVFSSNGARFGLRGAGGVELRLHRQFAIIAEVGVEHMLNAEPGRAETLFVPAIGAIGRL